MSRYTQVEDLAKSAIAKRQRVEYQEREKAILLDNARAEINRLTQESAEFQVEAASARIELGEARAKIAELTSAQESLNKIVEDARGKINELQQPSGVTRQEYTELLETIRYRTNTIENLRGTIDGHIQTIAELRRDKNNLSVDIGQYQKTIFELRQQNDKLQGQNNNLRMQNDKLGRNILGEKEINSRLQSAIRLAKKEVSAEEAFAKKYQYLIIAEGKWSYVNSAYKTYCTFNRCTGKEVVSYSDYVTMITKDMETVGLTITNNRLMGIFNPFTAKKF